MIDIKDEEKLQILADNKAELNYRELTNYLELPYLRGNAKETQLNYLSKLIYYEKNKNKYKFIKLVNYVNDDCVIIEDNHIYVSRDSVFTRLSNIPKKDEHKSGIYKIQLGNDIYIGQTKDFKQRFKEHYYGANKYVGFGADTQSLLRNGGTFEVLEFEENKINRLLSESNWVQYYINKGFNVINTTTVLSTKESQNKKSLSKYIIISKENYQKAITVLKEHNLL